MSASRVQTIERLLWEGQDHFRRHDAVRAEACWRRVLELDPNEARAAHLLQSAQRSREGFMAELRPQLQQLFEARRFTEMVDMLEVAKVRCPTTDGTDGIDELLLLVKQRVVHDCYAALGGLDRVPLPVNIAGRLLSQSAVTVAALIDGYASVRTLLLGSTLGQFSTLLALHELLQFAALQFANAPVAVTVPSADELALLLGVAPAPAVALRAGAYTRRTKPGYAFKVLPPAPYVPAGRMGTNGFTAQVPNESPFDTAYNAVADAYVASDYTAQAEALQQLMQERPASVLHKRRR